MLQRFGGECGLGHQARGGWDSKRGGERERGILDPLMGVGLDGYRRDRWREETAEGKVEGQVRCERGRCAEFRRGASVEDGVREAAVGNGAVGTVNIFKCYNLHK